VQNGVAAHGAGAEAQTVGVAVASLSVCFHVHWAPEASDTLTASEPLINCHRMIWQK